MTLTYIASANLGNSPIDTCVNPSNNTVIVIDSTPHLLQYSLVTGVSAGPTATLSSSPKAVTLINSLSAVVYSNNGTNGSNDFVELSTGYKQNVANTSPASVNQVGFKSYGLQMAANDPVSQVSYACCSSTTNTLIRTSNFVNTFPSVGNTGYIFVTIINIGPSAWLCGDENGNIFQIDNNANITDTWSLNLPYFMIAKNINAQSFINQMAYDNNILWIATQETVIVMDWSTKQILKVYTPWANNTHTYPCFGNSASGIILGALYAVTGIGLYAGAYEWDLTVNPFNVNSYVQFPVVDSIVVNTGISPNSSTGFYLDVNGALRIFSIATRPSTTRTITVQSASSGGSNYQARLTIIDDTSGCPNSFVVLDTLMNSPGTYRVPTGRTLMEVVKVGTGATSQWDVTRYST